MNDQLHSHPLFKTPLELLSREQSIALSYERAKLIMKTYPLTANDVLHCTPRFWSLFTHPLCAMDIAMFVIFNTHLNLMIGTLCRHLNHRSDLKSLVNRMLRVEALGLFLLTERGHGLDSFNIETTATKTADGFILHTPREEAAKFMPGTSPHFGIEKVALVMARLIVDNEDRGARYFIVPICNDREMYKGVECIRLPPRSGTTPFDFAITRFNNVYLPSTALVASDINDLSRPKNPLKAWWDENHRLQLGTLLVGGPWMHATKAVAYIAGQYSMHRCILDRNNVTTPIIKFRTQQWPVVEAVAVGVVMSEWYFAVIKALPPLDQNVRHALAVIAKTTIIRHFQRCVREVSERCGAQGTFEHNYMARIENDVKGGVIAEGDVLATCIRLFSELILGRYAIPLPSPEESLLAQHAASVLEENIELFGNLKCDHRSKTFNNIILPQSQPVVEAMGHALAYSAALKAKMPKYILDVYECAVIRQDSAWYSERAGITRLTQRLREDAAVTAILPHLPDLLSRMDISKYVSAPIISDSAWKVYLAKLPVYSGNAVHMPIMQLQAML